MIDIHCIQCDIREDIIIKNANLLISLGLVDVGYNYVNINDCYSERQTYMLRPMTSHEWESGNKQPH
ncbi:hypothetical protein F5J12DRAFT_896612 [Pisolithus orientalis]|uniref:uncharacterized protein n=1 Tax=Pisolithus orientalis TaxID=936130 RepID=UPI002225264D|nr:uncharacterized protein F5J12DRAFT_896612 [Pisolithus orientalis]KAI5994917.1 hypothetical protein F5J12DRAFT_896612 [Pisolithus orientalis]